MRDLFQLGEKYRLELMWDDVIYEDNTCKFVNASLSPSTAL